MKSQPSKPEVKVPRWASLIACGVVWVVGVFLFSVERWSFLAAWGTAAIVGIAFIAVSFMVFIEKKA